MMKRTLLALMLLLALSTPTLVAHSQVTAVPQLMNFQGRLAKPDGTPVPDTNTQSLTFRLYDALTAGNKLWQQGFPASVTVHNGTFAVALNFTAGYTAGNNLDTVFGNPLFTPYLEIQVGKATPLTPRHPFTSVAYSLYAGTALSVPNGSITNGNIVSLDASKLTNTAALNGTFWNLGGNAGTSSGANFIGTTDNQALIFKVNGHGAMFYTYATGAGIRGINVVGGAEINYASAGVVGATVAGGGLISVAGTNAPNGVTANFGTVGGGRGNTAGSVASTIGGGSLNTVSGNFGAVGGGESNLVSGHHGTVPGGASNVAAGIGSLAAGQQAQANHNGTFVWNDGTNAVFASSGINQFLIHATGGVGINTSSPGIALDDAGGLSVDSSNLNSGVIDGAALHFGGGGTGEGLGSKRTAGGNQYGLDFYTNYNNRMAIDINGNVGIGTSSPGITLDDRGGLSVDGANLNSGGIDRTALHFGGAGAGEGLGSKRTTGGNQYGLDFYTNYTNRMAITSNGNIGIGTTSPIVTLDVNGSGSFTSTTAYPGVYGYSTNGGGVSGGSANNIGVFGTSDNSWGVYGLSYSGNSAGVYGLNTQIGGYGVIGQSSYGIGVRGESSFGTAIYANGSAGGTTNWNGASDIRYKTNVRTLYNALDTILALRGVNFDWKRSDFPDKNFPEGRQVGFIAQEIEKFLPEVVSTDGNGYKSVAYASVVPILVEAVKTLKKDNDATKQENARKDARISELEAKLNALAEAVHQLQNDRK